ncbi:penicillin-binding protein [Streptomyces zinciresistens K42]|uniref:Penicillin-binding protein n=1 Tax=Streptomyces zinciresistens K42 TaxID=700597 RepID=G2GCW9_9ACTN|nr:penicillin-binding protein [Streptomyces zinciresistens K42]
MHDMSDESQPQPKAQAHPDRDPEPEAVAQPEPEREPEPRAEAQPDREAEARPKPGARPEPEPKAEAGPAPDRAPEPEPKAGPAPAAAPGPKAGPSADRTPGPKAGPRPDLRWQARAEAPPAPGPRPGTEPESDPDPMERTQALRRPKAPPAPAPGAEATAGTQSPAHSRPPTPPPAQAYTQAQPQSQAQTQAQPQTQGHAQGHAQAPAQTQAQSQIQPETQARQESGGKPRRPKRTGWRRLVPTWRILLGTFVIGVLLLGGVFFLAYSLVKIPPANALATKQANVYLYSNGSVIARDGEVNRENITLAQMSKASRYAILAAEDRDFYTESAIDPKAMLRAAWNTATGKGKQSGSTITQQYVKNYYLRQEQTVTRKAKEFIIAVKLDREKSKNEILEGYLNTSFFGRNSYGIQAAAQAYYGMDAKDLDPARAAYLAALVNAPSEYDVVARPENKEAVLARWNYVLDGMVKKGWLGASERAGLKFPMPKETATSTGLSGQRGYIVQIVQDHLIKNRIVAKEELDRGGYRITTTLQKDKQDAFVDAVNDKLISRLDKKNRKVDNYVRAGGASVDPKTGKVVAMYNGIDYVKQYTPNATRRDFQVGSTFKPFVFTSAVENGSTTQDGRTITPNTVYDGTDKRPVQGWSGGSYAPGNEDDVSYGNVTVRAATDKSVNSVYAQMAVDVGPDKVKKTAVALGLPAATPDLQPYPSIALGTATASVLDMAEAYATLANNGKHGTYTLVEKVTRDGADVIELPARKTTQAISREAADTTTSVLRSVVDNGTATAALAAGRPAAGKTGTAEEDQAAWFAGYTPDLATVVAVMGQDPVTAKHKSLYGVMGLPRINGGGAPTEIWAQFTKQALKGKPAKQFDLRLQENANAPQDPTTDPTAGDPSTGGEDGGASGQPTPGQDTEGQTGGQTPGEPDGGLTEGGQNGGTGDGGATDGGTGGESTGGTGDGGTTDGSTSGGTGSAGTDTGGQTGGTTDGSTNSGGTGTTGTTVGLPGTTRRE